MDTEGWIVAYAAMALLIRVGMGLYVTGLCRAKDAGGAVLRSLCDLCVATLAFWAVGNAILQHLGNGWLGIQTLLLFNIPDRFIAGSFLSMVLVLIGTGILVGVLAERTRFFAACGASLLLAAVVLPVVGHWAWSGWLAALGFTDVAGASAIHLAAAVFAAVGAGLVGARNGKYNHDGSSNAIPGHNIPLALVGVLVMLVGWLPYLLGASQWTRGAMAPGLAAANVLLAGAAGGVVALLLGRWRYGKPEVFLTYGGLLGGLVAISAAGGTVSSLSAVLIGAVAGILVPLATILIDLWLRLDDPTGQIAIHGIGGAWGTLAVALFLPYPWHQKLSFLGVQALGILAIGVLAAAISLLFFGLLQAARVLRSPEADEYDGLDLAELDINAYPDFQQTMIKSYHMREA